MCFEMFENITKVSMAGRDSEGTESGVEIEKGQSNATERGRCLYKTRTSVRISALIGSRSQGPAFSRECRDLTYN